MVIGYGFNDQHINEVLMKAADQHGLKLYVISPEGDAIARNRNPTRRQGQIICPTPLEHLFNTSLIGVSRRPLSRTFGGDVAEHAKVMQFFK